MNAARNRRSARGLSGFVDDIGSTISGLIDPKINSQCLDQANAQVAELDARILDLASTWHPTGFYAPADVQKLIAQTMALLSSATDTVGKAPRSTSDSEAQIQQALDTLFQHGQRELVYTQALQDAARSGATVINAAGLKDWVLDSMQAASSALVTASVMECNMPWLADAILALAPLFDALASVAKRVVDAAVGIGTTILKIADDLPQIWTVVKWGAVIAAALWGYSEMRKRGRG
jgi:uncharacterized protein YukE